MADKKVVRTKSDLVDAMHRIVSTEELVILEYEGDMEGVDDATLAKDQLEALEKVIGRVVSHVVRA